MTFDIHPRLKDLTRLEWSERANTSGTGGTFLKARETTTRGITYFKLSCYDSYRGIYGHECVNELIASRLMKHLGIDHVAYHLVHAKVLVDGQTHETWLSASDSFRSPKERKQALDVFYDLHREGQESPLDFCARMGWKRTIDQLMVVDFLLANRDRHGANIEVILGPEGKARLAPIFDTGLSLIFSAYGDEVAAEQFAPLSDVSANNYLGTRSLFENLSFVDAPLVLPALTRNNVEALVGDLAEVLPAAHREKIAAILVQRWDYLISNGFVQEAIA